MEFLKLKWQEKVDGEQRILAKMSINMTGDSHSARFGCVLLIATDKTLGERRGAKLCNTHTHVAIER